MQFGRAIVDYYRCPERFFKFKLSGPLSTDEGFFRFGSNIGFGRSCSGPRSKRVTGNLYDVAPDVAVHGTQSSLPFNPSDVIDNLRLERYHQSAPTSRWAKSAYYAVRPWLPPAVRKTVQKLRHCDWQSLPFPAWPVDRTVESICEQMMLLALKTHPRDEKIPFIWFWPRGALGCVVMTHDVETPAGRDACLALMELDESFGVPASFQIVPEDRYEVSPDFLASIRERGFEVCIQDLNHDGRLFDDREKFLRRATMINRYAKEYGATCFRSAVLYRKPEWYSAFELSVDMSIPTVAHLDPQRGGCCTVMPFFIGSMLELPLTTTQDYMLFHILNQRSIELWKTQIRMVLEKHGIVSFIVHPDYLTSDDTRSVYRDLLNYLKGMRSSANLWFALPHEVNRWWRLRSQMSLVFDEGSWRIVGEGSEQAQLAYAVRDSDKVAYEIPSQNLVRPTNYLASAQVVAN